MLRTEMKDSSRILGFEIKVATEQDVPLILSFIKELAEYVRLSHKVVATEATLRESLFGRRRMAEVVIGYYHGQPVSFALFYYNFSTFLGRSGIYLEDLYVRPDARGKGIGRSMVSHLAQLAIKHGCSRLEWWVLDWNEPAIAFYKRIGAVPMDECTVYRLSEEALERLAEVN